MAAMPPYGFSDKRAFIIDGKSPPICHPELAKDLFLRSRGEPEARILRRLGMATGPREDGTGSTASDSFEAAQASPYNGVIWPKGTRDPL